ncbi:MAG: hypothetical protein FWE23_01880 [Chitinivibrionia bacterium]|nr:hypothetical protein [Chitinivibrionia bacterium]
MSKLIKTMAVIFVITMGLLAQTTTHRWEWSSVPTVNDGDVVIITANSSGELSVGSNVITIISEGVVHRTSPVRLNIGWGNQNARVIWRAQVVSTGHAVEITNMSGGVFQVEDGAIIRTTSPTHSAIWSQSTALAAITINGGLVQSDGITNSINGGPTICVSVHTKEININGGRVLAMEGAQAIFDADSPNGRVGRINMNGGAIIVKGSNALSSAVGHLNVGQVSHNGGVIIAASGSGGEIITGTRRNINTLPENAEVSWALQGDKKGISYGGGFYEFLSHAAGFVNPIDVSQYINFSTFPNITYNGMPQDRITNVYFGIDQTEITLTANPSWRRSYSINSNNATGNEKLCSDGLPINAGIYSITAILSTSNSKYFGTATTEVEVLKRQLHFGEMSHTKVIDGTTTAENIEFSFNAAHIVEGDEVSATVVGEYEGFRTHSRLVISQITIGGADGGNYSHNFSLPVSNWWNSGGGITPFIATKDNLILPTAAQIDFGQAIWESELASNGEGILEHINWYWDWIVVDLDSVPPAGEHEFSVRPSFMYPFQFSDFDFSAVEDIEFKVALRVNKRNLSELPTAPSGLTARTCQTLAVVNLPSGWSWKESASTSVGAVGNRAHKAIFTPTDPNYNSVEIDVEIAVSDHNWGDLTTTKVATCAEAGEIARVCSLCNAKTEVAVIPALCETITDKFTDPNFRAAVYSLIGKTAPVPIFDIDVRDIDTLDLQIINETRAARNEATIPTIRNLSGIEHFVSLEYLNVSGHDLTELDLSKNVNLTYLNVDDNRIASIDDIKGLDNTQIQGFNFGEQRPTSIRHRQPTDTRYGIIVAENPVSDAAKISVITPEQATINLRIMDNLGNVVFMADGVGATALGRHGGNGCPQQSPIVWNLTNPSGRFVANGTYLIIVEATGISGRRFTYSARIGVSK